MALTVNSRDIVLIQLGNVGESIEGHEQAGTRPCIVIKALSRLKLAIVLPVTSSRPKGIPSVVHLKKGAGNLDRESYVLCHQIRVISFKRIVHKIGILSAHEFAKIKWALGDLLDL